MRRLRGLARRRGARPPAGYGLHPGQNTWARGARGRGPEKCKVDGALRERAMRAGQRAGRGPSEKGRIIETGSVWAEGPTRRVGLLRRAACGTRGARSRHAGKRFCREDKRVKIGSAKDG